MSQLETKPEECSKEHSTRRYFILVCPEAREEEYRAVLSPFAHDVEILFSIDDMLARCVHEPPLALLLDMAVVTRAGSRVLAPIFELRMGWPVIRCSLLPGGQLNGLCMDPQEHGPLAEMLDAISANDEVWRIRPGTARWRRRHLRIEMQCRVRWRPCDGTTWYHGNTLDIGAGGIFLVTYEETAEGTSIELVLSDLTEEPVEMTGQVVGARRWENGRELPGLSVAFDTESIPSAFKQALAESIRLADLL